MADRRSFRSISFALARSVPSAAVLLAVCWLATVMPVAAQIQTGEFAAGESWFFNGASLGVLPPASTPDGTIEVDTNGDGQTDTTFDTPGELEPAPGLAFEYRLSPSERTLYVKKWGPTVCGGGTNVQILLYDLSAPPMLVGFTSAQGPACLTGGVDIQPSFWDQSGPVRTMVMVGQGTPTVPQVLWADLVAGEYAIDSSSYTKNIGIIRFAPSGNAALITHGIQTGVNGGDYSFVDLCAHPLGGGLGAPQSWTSGIPSARVIEISAGSYEAELLVDGVPEPGSQVALSTACYGTGAVGCCRVGSSCSTASSPAACASIGGTPVPSACPGGNCCADVECVEACCSNGACSLLDRIDCITSGGTLPSEAGCNGTVCPEAIQACCLLDGNCYDTTESSCVSYFPPGTVQGIGTSCGSGSVNCPRLNVALTKSGPATFTRGDTFSYTIDYLNDGDVTAPGVTVQDVLPFGLDVVSVGGGGVDTFGTIDWTLGDLTVGQSGSLMLTVKAGCFSPVGFASNQATAASMGLTFYSNSWGSTALDEPGDPLTVSVLSTPSDGLPVEGNDTISHAITLTNTLNQVRHDIDVTIQVGSGLTLESVIDAAGGTVGMYTPTSWHWVGDLAPLATVTVIVTSRVDPCVQETEVELKRLFVTTTCGIQLNEVPAELFPVRRPVEVEASGAALYPPTTLTTFLSRQRMQVLRDGATVDFRFVVSNPHPTPIVGATASVRVPFGFTAVGSPPFVAPSDAAAVWTAPRDVTWTGDLAPGQVVTITFRAMESGTATATTLSGQASNGACTIDSTESLAIIPELPTTPYLIGLQDGRLVTVRPGIDTAEQPLFGFTEEYVEGLGRGAGGDLWVAGVPTFRFNPETLELDGYPLSLFTDLGFNPSDVAVDPTDGTLVFAGVTTNASGSSIATLRRYDPASGMVTLLFDETEPFPTMQGVSDVVVEPGGEIGFVSSSARLYRFDPVAATMTELSDSSSLYNYATLAADVDGSYLVSQLASFQSIPMADVNPQDGDHDVFVPDLQALVPTAELPGRAMAAGDGGDVYFAFAFSGLGVVHRQPALGGEELLPFDFFGREMKELEFVSAGLCADGDGDGVDAGPGCTGGPVDCDDADPSVYPGAEEINDGKDNQCSGDPGYGVVDELTGSAGFTVPGDPSQLCWPAQSGATQYEVIRSSAPDFSVGCVSSLTTGTCWTEPGTPPVDVTWYYLVRPVAPSVGSWGQDAAGAERAIVCP